MPEWYTLIRAARHLHVAPWELSDQCYLWMEWAIASEYADNKAEQILNDRANKRHKK